MKISVVTPSFNQGEFLERTILSVIEQDHTQLEYIIMDGGSEDNSLDVIRKYENSIFHFESKPDRGQTCAVNKGIKMASGEVIGWLNSDDVYYPGTLSAIAQIFQNHPEVGVIYGDADHIDVKDGFIETYKTEPWDYERLKQICYICQPAVFFRKAIFDKHGPLDEKLHYCMDYEFWLRLGQHLRFSFIQRKLAGSRLYESNKTLGSRLKVHTETVRMFRDKFGTVPNRWIAALSHFETIEGEGMPNDNWALRKYLLKTAYHWNKNQWQMNKRIMPKDVILDLLSIVKASSTVFHNRLDASKQQ